MTLLIPFLARNEMSLAFEVKKDTKWWRRGQGDTMQAICGVVGQMERIGLICLGRESLFSETTLISTTVWVGHHSPFENVVCMYVCM